MSLTSEEVKKIAYLARLSINDDDIEHYARELSGILDLVEQMNAVNTEDVKPMAHPQDASQRMREDVVTETNQREKYQKVAPVTEAGLFLVPKVIE
jgi:aspartyl-tRNA(Asn)/glutamyl-tRNA(Gln) amidotransferase subunit C